MKKIASLVVSGLLLVGLNAQAAFDCNGNYPDDYYREDLRGTPIIRAGIESGVSTDGKAFEDGGGFLSVTGINQCEADHICRSLGMQLPTLGELQDNYDKLGRKPYDDANQYWVWSSSVASDYDSLASVVDGRYGGYADSVIRGSRGNSVSARCVR